MPIIEDNSDESEPDNDVDQDESISDDESLLPVQNNICTDVADNGPCPQPSRIFNVPNDHPPSVPSEIETINDNEDISDTQLAQIDDHGFRDGHLHFLVRWPTDETSWERYDKLRTDYPHMTAEYIEQFKPSRTQSPTRTERLIHKWAHHQLRQRNRRINCIMGSFEFGIDLDNNVVILRRKKKSKKKKNFFERVFQYGTEVPRNVKHAIQLDQENNNTKWQDAMATEIAALDKLDCFQYNNASYRPPPEYQKTKLRMIFAVKHDFWRKARLVAGGHLIELADNIKIYSLTVKTLSVRLLDVIADANNLKQLCGDVGNAFVNAYTKEKIYCIAGPEFGDRQGSIIILKKALYGLRSSAERFHAYFANHLRSMGFVPCRHDDDVWI